MNARGGPGLKPCPTSNGVFLLVATCVPLLVLPRPGGHRRGRRFGPDFLRFLNVAFASARELEYQLLLAHDLDLLNQERYESLTGETTEVKHMLTRFMQTVRSTRATDN
jgi:hypothetical protein